MANLSPNESKLIERIRAIKGYKSMFEDELLGALISSKPVRKSKKPKTNFSKARKEEIRKELSESRHKFYKSKINEVKQNLYEIENEENLSGSKIKGIRRSLLELEENVSRTKKYYHYDDIEYKGARNVKDLFDLSVDEDYYEPVITKSAFNDNYIQWKIQLTIAINFISSKYSDETRTMHANSDNVEIMIGSETNEMIEELFKSLL